MLQSVATFYNSRGSYALVRLVSVRVGNKLEMA